MSDEITTLDEAITYTEKIAGDQPSEGDSDCVRQHKQLAGRMAGWLKELKALRERQAKAAARAAGDSTFQTLSDHAVKPAKVPGSVDAKDYAKPVLFGSLPLNTLFRYLDEFYLKTTEHAAVDLVGSGCVFEVDNGVCAYGGAV